ncbi:MAG: ATP-dependent sacrificial sulfur transferase LarE [Methanospirillaceae archaeon]|nr:ATP-dependent sacrificial sulfur transferase LarE [Methanospirillaceae archaeon]
MDTEQKIKDLAAILHAHAPLLIAYSGGIDSSVLAALSREVLGTRGIQCVLLIGPELSERAYHTAREIAEELSLPFTTVPAVPLSEEIRKENPATRCRLCKLGNYPVLEYERIRYGCRFIADGANASDLLENRPGIDAFTSCGVIHPYIMAGITKDDIREIARKKGYSFWNLPSSACLYSRIPYGEEITDEKLLMIEKGEDILNDYGFCQARVRHHGTIARIEVLPAEMAEVLRLREKIEEKFHTLGFCYVTLDLKGYRSGSMDETDIS